jgi:hypothetical protein
MEFSNPSRHFSAGRVLFNGPWLSGPHRGSHWFASKAQTDSRGMCLFDHKFVYLIRAQDDPLGAFVPEVEAFLREFLRLEGRGDHLNPTCPFCKVGVAAIRCIDCFGGTICCHDCTVSIHAQNPLHRIQVCAQYYGKIHYRSQFILGVDWPLLPQNIVEKPWASHSARPPCRNAMPVPQDRFR